MLKYLFSTTWFLLLSMISALTLSASSTTVCIEGDYFHINHQPTYEGRSWRVQKGGAM